MRQAAQEAILSVITMPGLAAYATLGLGTAAALRVCWRIAPLWQRPEPPAPEPRRVDWGKMAEDIDRCHPEDAADAIGLSLEQSARGHGYHIDGPELVRKARHRRLMDALIVTDEAGRSVDIGNLPGNTLIEIKQAIYTPPPDYGRIICLEETVMDLRGLLHSPAPSALSSGMRRAYSTDGRDSQNKS